MSKGLSTLGSKVPFKSNQKNPECAFKRDLLKLFFLILSFFLNGDLVWQTLFVKVVYLC